MYTSRLKYRNIEQARGFTLIEVMVVVVIIGILSYFIVPNLLGTVDDARITKAKLEISTLQNSLSMYRVENGSYPTQEQGLAALVTKPEVEPVPRNWRRKYINKLPKDPWGNDYQYRNPGEYGDVDIFSFGNGGENQAEESNYIGNWDLN